MKRIWLVAGIIWMSVGTAFAQERFSFGPKVGVSVSNLYINAEGVEESDIVGIKPGLLIGAFAEYDFTPALGVSVDLLYSVRVLKVTVSTIRLRRDTPTNTNTLCNI